MKPSVQQKSDNLNEYFARFDSHMQSAQQSYRREILKQEPYELLGNQGDRKLVVPGLPAVDLNDSLNDRFFDGLEQVKDSKGYKVLVIKRWCESALTPMAWKRTLVRTVPDMRTLGYDLDELQNPSPSTRINAAYFQVICATLVKLYSTNATAA